MTLLNTLKRILPHELRQTMKRRLFFVRDMRTRLENLRRAGFLCTGVIDGGAYEGGWSREFWHVFPEAPSVLVEPQTEKTAFLSRAAAAHPGSRVLCAALGAEPGRVSMILGETNSRVANEETAGDRVEVAQTTIDAILHDIAELTPNMLKLDLQGYEVEALKGCSDLASVFEVIVIEVSILRIGEVPIFHELDGYLEERGFRLYDFIPQYYRPRDGALWQGDAFYVRRDSSLIESRDWA
jgi:FkbM family methyltransferase